MPFTIKEFHDLVKILEKQPQWRDELRRLLLTDELLELPKVVRQLAERMDVLTDRVNSLTEQMINLTQRVDSLTEQMSNLTLRVDSLTEQMINLTQRVDSLTQRVDSLTQRVDTLTEQVSNLTQQVSSLVEWQRGEAGRREGERYERNLVRRAIMLFAGGSGGTADNPLVQERLSGWLRKTTDGEKFLETDEDPTLSDLIWWKGERVVVVEASIKVNGEDVIRAFKRAGTLRSAGVNANSLVIGEEWESEKAKELAREMGVWWKVADDISEGLISFRRIEASYKELA